MGTVRIVLFLVFFTVSACANSQNSNKKELPQNTNSTNTLVGQWYTELPCADCTGIRYHLALNSNNTFQATSHYVGKNTNPLVETGTWQITKNNVLQLIIENKVSKQFIVSNQWLTMLDQKGNRIKSKTKDQYKLQKREAKEETNIWDEKRNRGVDLIGKGNEPFWMVEIDFDKSIFLKSLYDNSEITFPNPQKETLDSGIVKYIASTGKEEVTVTLIPDSCTDSMSGEASPLKVEVKTSKMTYTGCGFYLKDEKLKGKWQLVSMNNKQIQPRNEQTQPFLEFDLVTNRISGNAGCNRVGGNFEIEGNSIKLNQMFSTKMACPAMNLEIEFLNILNDATLNYKIEADKLTFYKDSKEMLVFRRVGK